MSHRSSQEWSHTKRGPGRKHALPILAYKGEHAIRGDHPAGTKLLRSTPSGEELHRTRKIPHYPKYTGEWT